MTLVLNVLPKKSLWDIQGEKSGRKLEMVIETFLLLDLKLIIHSRAIC